MGVLGGPVISVGSLGSHDVSLSDDLIVVELTLSINVGYFSCNVFPIYLFESHFDCDDKRG